jgi:hypothetical protein
MFRPEFGLAVDTVYIPASAAAQVRDQAKKQLTTLPLNGLANGTEMAASLGDADAHNISAAARTRLAGAPEHIECLGVAPGPVARKIKVCLARAQ